ncbi:MAG: HEAT repeat domain-containing protein, partial [Planctomycetia bacterium]|nr:HEAT repeat domain-containing protein [Planctomycetia bacterium]
MRSNGFSLCVGLLAVLAGTAPLSAQSKSSSDGTPYEVGGKRLDQWIQILQKDKDASNRQQAIHAIIGFRQNARPAVPALMDATGYADALLRGDAAAALGMLGAMDKAMDPDDVPKAVAALSKLVSSYETQRSVRVQATLALAQFGGRARGAVTAVAGNANDSVNWELRRSVCYTLGRIGMDTAKGPDPTAMTTLTTKLNDPCAEVRLAAIMALSAMGLSPRAAEVTAEKAALEPLLKDPDKQVAIWARVLLMFLDEKLITTANLGQLSKALVSDSDPKVRSTAARALGILGTKARQALPDLLAGLNDREVEVVLTVVGVLGQMTDSARQVIPELERCMDDPNPAVRGLAARSLANLGDQAKGSVSKVIGLLKDKDDAVVYSAILALTQLGAAAEPALGPLKAIADTHKDENVKSGAQDAIRVINEK